MSRRCISTSIYRTGKVCVHMCRIIFYDITTRRRPDSEGHRPSRRRHAGGFDFAAPRAVSRFAAVTFAALRIYNPLPPDDPTAVRPPPPRRVPPDRSGGFPRYSTLSSCRRRRRSVRSFGEEENKK